MKTIIIFFNIQLPEGSAAATRACAWGELLKKAGYSPIMLGVNYYKSNIINGVYKEIPYYLIDTPELQNKGLKSIKRDGILKRKIEDFIVEISAKKEIQAIILGNPEVEVKWLLKVGKKINVPIIPDIVEWYDISRFNGKFALIRLLQNRTTLRYWNVKAHNVICISSLLEKYYSKRGCNTLRIPTILDTKDFRTNVDENNKSDKIILAYAGSPAKKDLIINVAKALYVLDSKDRAKVKLRVYGINLEELKNLGLDLEIIEEISDSLECFGKIPHNELINQVSQADYTVLLRPNKRYANAGFPTKVGESMAMRVPVIANITSDIGKYLHDNIEGIICEDESPVACASAIKKAISLSTDNNKEMRMNAGKQAERSFDYRNYVDQVRIFIEEIKK